MDCCRSIALDPILLFIDSRSKIGGIKPSFLIRKLLIPLLAELALPTAVNTESYWLILKSNYGQAEALLD